MGNASAREKSVFAQYAASYDAALAQGLRVSGEDKEYFARGRIVHLARCVDEMGYRAQRVMDFGCGIGSATPFVQSLLRPETTIGVDVSPESLEVAQRTYGSDRVRFALFDDYEPCGEMDVVFCNGVFHHIPLSERSGAIDYVCRSLRPGGLFALWENNPWNPGARYVMWRIPFDRDAIMVAPPEARRLVQSGGLEIVRTDFLFIFPRALRWFRAIEVALERLPLGAQYQVLCRKP
jgi:SAM-dependent methyltransferase